MFVNRPEVKAVPAEGRRSRQSVTLRNTMWKNGTAIALLYR